MRSSYSQKLSANRPVNVGEKERSISALSGIAILGYGIIRRSAVTPFLIFLGGALLRRGWTGHCPAYHQLGRDTTRSDDPSGNLDQPDFSLEKEGDQV